jgi:hypothetical protein
MANGKGCTKRGAGNTDDQTRGPKNETCGSLYAHIFLLLLPNIFSKKENCKKGTCARSIPYPRAKIFFQIFR